MNAPNPPSWAPPQPFFDEPASTTPGLATTPQHAHPLPRPAPLPPPPPPSEPLPLPTPGPLPAPALPEPVAESEPVRVSVDNNRCHIYGICQQEAPEVFRISDGGSLHYTATVPAPLAARTRQAARCCPMQAIAVRRAGPAGALATPRRPAPAPAPRTSGAPARIVVAGAGPAGLSAAARLRARGYDGELVIIGDEPHRPYSRPPLSKQFLTDGLDHEDLLLRTDDDLDAHWLLGSPLISLDPADKTVVLRGGEHLRYDGLVIATGVDARRLPETPLPSDRIRTLRTLADAATIREAMRAARARHVVILGGGFVGCELACTTRAQGMDVTLVVQGTALLGRVLGGALGAVVEGIQRRAGVDVRLRTRITDWTDTGSGLLLRLDDGETVEADFVVLGLGGVPRTDWLNGSGLDLRDGVLCGTTCHATDAAGRPVPGIVAAGDVARWPNPRFDDTPRRVEHLIHAVEMGQHAADSLLRGPEDALAFTPVPRFWSEQHGTRLQAVGAPALGERIEIVAGSIRSERFVAAYQRSTPQGAQLVAAVAFDMPRELMDYRDRIGLTRTVTAPTRVPHPARTRPAGRRRRR
ncbi:FAD-dependent oxidoreductase [Kitasatospora sp. NPDC088346]|uniref:FAD-dependent oxidoreductase n=1 Tax=Kitasatospora sp. NPDC088346 TaxID=3364073 RepID=UPI00381DBC2F